MDSFFHGTRRAFDFGSYDVIMIGEKRHQLSISHFQDRGKP